MKGKKYLIALLAAAALLSGCGSADGDEAGTDTETASAQTEDTASDNAASLNDTAEDNAPEETASAAEESVSESGGEDSSSAKAGDTSSAGDADISQSADDGESDGYARYVNDEFGFELVMPEGTEINEVSDELKPLFDDDAVQFRVIAESSSNDSFNMAVMYYETSNTLDDFESRLRANAENENAAETGSEIEILGVSDETFGSAAAKIITQRLSGDGDFYTVYAYFEIDGGYIYAQYNCYDEETMNSLLDFVRMTNFK